MGAIFSKIVQGKIPSYKVAENEYFLAFLDINPLAQGHTLVIPKQEIDYIFDIDDAMLGEMMVFAKKVAHAIRKHFPCQKVGVAVIGLEVNHAHIHLVPINNLYDLDFKQPKLQLSAEQFTAIAQLLSDTISNI
jgi:histidine triad (HIT) family protein